MGRLQARVGAAQLHLPDQAGEIPVNRAKQPLYQLPADGQWDRSEGKGQVQLQEIQMPQTLLWVLLTPSVLRGGLRVRLLCQQRSQREEATGFAQRRMGQTGKWWKRLSLPKIQLSEEILRLLQQGLHVREALFLLQLLKLWRHQGRINLRWNGCICLEYCSPLMLISYLHR